MPKTKPKILDSRLFYLVLLVISGLLIILPLIFKLDLGSFRSLGILGVALLNFISSATIFFPAPGILATGVGGSLYNPIIVALASSIGSTLGESVGFIFGHSSRKIHKKIHENRFFVSINKILRHKYGFILIILLAFIPNPFFDVMGIIAGLALYPLRKFLLLVFIGRFARDIIIASLVSRFA